MADFVKLIECMKRAALDAVDASSPVTVAFGTVTSASPLEINVEQKMTLKEPQLILTRNVTDYYVDMTVQHITELEKEHTHENGNETAHTHAVQDTYTGGGSSSPTVHTHTMQPTDHLHAYKNKKRFLIHNALKNGELVLLLRVQGGQQYIILDRLEGSPDVTNGQWLP